MDTRHRADDREFLRRLHERPQKGLEEWLDAPAHVHHVAHRMANPPVERPKSREAFEHILRCLAISPDESVLHDTFGYGVGTADNRDRLILVWEAHTEYYSYQVWHIPADRTKPLSFGPLTFPHYVFQVSSLRLRVNSLDILIGYALSLRLKKSGPSCRGRRCTVVGSLERRWR